MQTRHLNAFTVTQSQNVWQLNRGGKPLAVIERAWDDHHWLLFLSDTAGELVCAGVYRYTATLKACLRLWARRLPQSAHCLYAKG